MVKKNTHKRSARTQTFLHLAILAAALIIVNLLASQYYHRFDLTKEKRFTLSKTTKELVKNLNTRLTFNVYLDGELNPKFKQLKNSLRDLLQEISSLSDGCVLFFHPRRLMRPIVQSRKGTTNPPSSPLKKNFTSTPTIAMYGASG